jgi:hypothetical protein
MTTCGVQLACQPTRVILLKSGNELQVYRNCNETLYSAFLLVLCCVLERPICIRFYLVEGSLYLRVDRLCGLVVRVLGYRSGGPGSIPGTTRFSGGGKENSSGSGTGYTQPREYT